MLKATPVCLLLMLTGFTSATALAASPTDERFIHHEAQGSVYEAELARLGQVRGARPEVRAFATTLVNDHEAYNGALLDLAKKKGIAIPSSMSAKDKRRLDRLAGTHGGGFDAAFLQEARRVNDDQVQTFRHEAKHTVDPDIRSFVARFLEVDEKHAAGARALSEHGVASRMPIIEPPRTGDTMPVHPPANDSKMPVILPSSPGGR